jgi:cytochrome b6-f complex iron-sulfur subunit
VDQKDNPTPPAESASGTQGNEQGDKQGVEEPDGGAHPSVPELLAAARGDAGRKPGATPPRTPVTPDARRASSGTVAAPAPPGDTPAKSVPSATPPASRVAPASGASKTTSTPTPSVNAGVARAVAARPPSKPPAAGPVVQSLPDPSINQMRRWMVWGSLFGFLGVLGLAMARFFMPRVLFEPPSSFRIGFPGDYALGVDTKLQQQHRVWVVRNSERLFVIFARCTHLGCTPDWKASENKFKCPCHGSGYDSEGVNFEGPAPRPMDRAEIKLDAEGQLVVNTGKLYDWQKGGTNHFNDEGAFIRI